MKKPSIPEKNRNNKISEQVNRLILEDKEKETKNKGKICNNLLHKELAVI